MSASSASRSRSRAPNASRDVGDPGLQALALPFGGRHAPPERLHLGPPPRGLLAHPATHVLDLATTLLRQAEGLLGLGQLSFAGLEIGQHPRQILLRPIELAANRVHPSGTRCLSRQIPPGGGLQLDGGPERLLRVAPLDLSGAERLLCVYQHAGGRGSLVGGRQHASIQLVQPRARGLAGLEALVPAGLAALLLAEERAQPGGGQLPRQLLGLRAQRLVLLSHLRLLLQRLELAPQLGQHVLKPEEILVEALQLPLGTFLPTAVLGYPRGLLDVLAPFLRTGQEDFFQLTLPNDRMQRTPDPRFGQELLHIE